MKRILIALLIPLPAMAQPYVYQGPQNPPGLPMVPAPGYVVPVQPVAPLGAPYNPYGTGYSVITKTKEREKNVFGRDVTDSETVTVMRPNDAWGNPIKTLQDVIDEMD